MGAIHQSRMWASLPSSAGLGIEIGLVGVFTSPKSADATNQAFFFFFY